MIYVPEISYAETDPDQVTAGLLDRIQTNLGRVLFPGDPLRLFALAFAAEDIQIRNLLDEAGRQNLLAYATGEYLDALGDLVGVTRLEAQSAIVTLRFTASAPAEEDITIPAATRATPGGGIYFATDEAAVIATGNTTVDVQASCTETGDAGNGYEIGEIDQIVDPIGGVPTVANTDASEGGVDIETDAAYRARIRLGVSRFSVAGPRDAYEYWARTASGQITDVFVTSPDPGYVDVYVLLAGGVLPTQDILDAVAEILEDVRPLTDFVTAKAPTLSNYTLNVTYYLLTDDEARATEIQEAVEAAIAEWVIWQRSAIGRDKNPSELHARIIGAGAKRASITAPTFGAIAATAIANCTSQTITYGGLEDE